MNDDSVTKSSGVTPAVSPQASPQGTQRSASRPPQAWEVEKDFTEGTSGITVRISVMRGYRNRYSLTIGRIQSGLNAGRFVVNVPVFVEVELARVSIRPYIDILMELLGQANEHIHNAAQLREDEIIENKQMGESKEANRNKPQTRHTGKTQRIKDRRTGKGSNQ